MPRTCRPRPKKAYTKIAVQYALAEHRQFEMSVGALAEKHKVPKLTLHYRLDTVQQRKLDASQCLLQIRDFSCLCVTLTFFILMPSMQKPVNGLKRMVSIRAEQWSLTGKYFCLCVTLHQLVTINHFKCQPHKMVKHIQTIHWLLPTDCLSVFDYFFEIELKG